MRLKDIPLLIICTLILSNAATQVSDDEIRLLKQLDSIARSSSEASHFARLYSETTAEAVLFFRKAEKKEKDFIRRLELTFADYFFRAVKANQQGKVIPAVWQMYFSDSSLKPLQYELLSINAHINGDIWQALTAEFTLTEIRENRRTYLHFQKGLNKIYNRFYSRANSASQKTRMLQGLSLGFDRFYGRVMLIRWRKRQYRLATIWFTRPDEFNKKIRALDRKMNRINQLILRLR
jgi:hypothetical protein